MCDENIFIANIFMNGFHNLFIQIYPCLCNIMYDVAVCNVEWQKKNGSIFLVMKVK